MNYQKAKYIQGVNPSFLTRRNLHRHHTENIDNPGTLVQIEADWIIQNGYAFEREENGKFQIRGPVAEVFGRNYKDVRSKRTVYRKLSK